MTDYYKIWNEGYATVGPSNVKITNVIE